MSNHFQVGNRVNYIFDGRGSSQKAATHSGQDALIKYIEPGEKRPRLYYLEFADGAIVIAFDSELRKI